MDAQPAETEPLWNYKTDGWAYSVAISSDGKYIVAGSWDGAVYLFSRDGGNPLWKYETGEHVLSVAITPDGQYVTAGNRQGKVYLFRRESSAPVMKYATNGPAQAVAISSDGQYVSVGTFDGHTYLFKRDSGNALWWYNDDWQIFSVAISPDGRYVVAGGGPYGQGGFVHLFDQTQWPDTLVWTYGIDSVSSVAISYNSSLAYSYIVAGSRGNAVYLLGPHAKELIWRYQTSGSVFSVAISSDGKLIAAESGEPGAQYTTYMFDGGSGNPLWSHSTDSDPGAADLASVALSSDGQYLAVGGHDSRVYFFSRNSGMPLWSYKTDGILYSVAVSSDGQYVVGGSGGGTVYFFAKDPTTGPTLPIAPIGVLAVAAVSVCLLWVRRKRVRVNGDVPFFSVCSNCGHRNSKRNRFCSACGQSLRDKTIVYS